MVSRPHSVVVIGGYGRVGRRLCARIGADGVEVTMVGRDRSRAERCASELSASNPASKVHVAITAAEDPALATAIARADIVIVAAPAGDSLARIAAACVDCGCDCLDIVPSPVVPTALQLVGREAARRGRLLVTQAGLCPGLPSALARAAARRVGRCTSVRVGIALGIKDASKPDDLYELIDAAVDYAPLVFHGGRWTRTSRGGGRITMDFGCRFGRRVGLPLNLPEMHGLERELDVQEMAVFGATSAWRVDAMGRAAIAALYRVRRGLGRHTAARALLALASRAPTPPGASVVAVAEGERNGAAQRLVVSVGHDDVADLTAVAVTAFLRQYFAGAYREEVGLRQMGHLFGDAALDDVRRLGAQVELPPPGGASLPSRVHVT